jgi:ribulose-phosphate 3-epimerase
MWIHTARCRMWCCTTPRKAGIAPSILSADFARLGAEVDAVLAAGADWVHFDVMDNHYVPNLTVGPLVCEALRKHGVTAPIDAHLMVKPVDRIIPDFAASRRHLHHLSPGSQRPHRPQPATDPRLRLPLRAGVQSRHPAGISEICDGQGGHGAADVGQSRLRRPEFHQRHPEKTARGPAADRRQRLSDPAGSGRRGQARQHPAIAEAGADTFVAGSAIFNTPDYRATIAALRAELAQADP